MLDQITPLFLTYNELPNIERTLAPLAWARRIVVSTAAAPTVRSIFSAAIRGSLYSCMNSSISRANAILVWRKSRARGFCRSTPIMS